MVADLILSCPYPTHPGFGLGASQAVSVVLSGFLWPQAKHSSSLGQVRSASELMPREAHLGQQYREWRTNAYLSSILWVDMKAMATQAPRRWRPAAHRGDPLVRATVTVSLLPHLTSPPAYSFLGYIPNKLHPNPCLRVHFGGT